MSQALDKAISNVTGGVIGLAPWPLQRTFSSAVTVLILQWAQVFQVQWPLQSKSLFCFVVEPFESNNYKCGCNCKYVDHSCNSYNLNRISPYTELTLWRSSLCCNDLVCFRFSGRLLLWSVLLQDQLLLPPPVLLYCGTRVTNTRAAVQLCMKALCLQISPSDWEIFVHFPFPPIFQGGSLCNGTFHRLLFTLFQISCFFALFAKCLRFVCQAIS